MKSKFFITLVGQELILGIGCAHAVGGPGFMGGHGAMMGGRGGTSHQGVDKESDSTSEQSQAGSGHDHSVPATGVERDNSQPYHPHGGPPYCP